MRACVADVSIIMYMYVRANSSVYQRMCAIKCLPVCLHEHVCYHSPAAWLRLSNGKINKSLKTFRRDLINSIVFLLFFFKSDNKFSKSMCF